MKIHEYQATEIFKAAGLPVVSGGVASELGMALQIADKAGYPVVLKSQVLVGGRGKAGGIKVVHNKEELEKAFGALKQLKIKGYAVEKILVVRAIQIKKEFYIGVTVDSAKDDVVLIASSAGGVDIEETARINPEAIKKFYLQGGRDVDLERLTVFVRGVFEDPSLQQQAKDIFQKLIKVFFEKDCSLAEINPLVETRDGQIVAADAKINFDDNALFRHPDIESMKDSAYEDADEQEARQYGLSFVKLDGHVGCIVNGAGLAMATMDIIKLLGGEPANFLDVGGSSNPQKVLNALKIILRNKKVKAILINIFGGITRCDDIAKGILEAKKQLDMPVPLVVRLTGTNEKEAKEILAQSHIQTYATMREAVQRVVALAAK
ncbi:MAG TPA: ADP-forming succinate--CoA ligase subunit beta [Candidatus Omnitrophica bacterium]|nr:MAG: succinate--CoA ligase subunit beta [Omnitrophica WOR_2 bacterium GWA2_45_18]OGX19422.1 MAG: succinate--CoA ligase subunit beta [Omnitrophica WOR_2 bacterium GWC2_45_7]HBR14126.1 ADP-forming succinate--CoA ligase subunit beta [Candidatus Omnitrophota bacterium]